MFNIQAYYESTDGIEFRKASAKKAEAKLAAMCQAVMDEYNAKLENEK